MARASTGSRANEERETSKRIGALAALWPFVRPYRVMMGFAIVALVATATVSLVLPLAVRKVVDNFNADESNLLDQYFAMAIVVVALLAFGTGMRYALVTRLGERVVTDIRKAVFERVINMSPAFYDNILTGEVLSRITTDTTLILSVIGASVSIALRNMLIFAGGLTMLLLTSVKLTGLLLLIVPIVALPVLTLGRRLRVLSRENQDFIAASSGNASEVLGALQTVQAFTHETASRQTFDRVTEKSFEVAAQRINTRVLMTMIVIYAILVAGSASALSEIWGELQRAAGATERLVELLQAQDTVPEPKNPLDLSQPLRGEIIFDDVHFRYPARPDRLSLSQINLTIKPGETVALVGPSGAGKTTIIQLILRFYDPTSGQVRLDGVNLCDLRRDVFRNVVALVPQDPVVFAASALENIRFGNPEASDEQVYAAARAAVAHEFITQLPDGYDSYLGERGVMLSGGQKQRIAIARAILRDAPVLLLDEATSALDAESEQAVKLAVEALSSDRTTIIIAHRLATVKKADRIVVMDKGQIVDTGTHDELVAKEGLYAHLARLQFTDGAAEV